ncbi:hypothetical protein Tco_0843493 [Tanacetum coccineum]|uniref:Reverse transcriptase zinc-binding domain-containing protein n=1 Tax=Tanacetum coccineum TaxID=301880 RepID=A0ABQ5B6C6_9ASTR
MRGFLWCQGELKKGKAKVDWESVCKPKLEGGLGIRRLEDFNVALMALTFEASSPIKNLYGLNRSIPISLRINNGKLTSMWFDKWHDLCPIRDLLAIRDITRSGFGLDDFVCDFISNGNWRWPPDWLVRVPGLYSILVPIRVDCNDVCLWCDLQGNLKPFSVACVWDSIRLRVDIVDWYHVVWFQVRGLADMDQIPPRFIDIVVYLIPISKGKSVVSVIYRLLLGAVSFHIWMERNSRLFKKKLSTVPQIVQVISSMVCLKLVSFKFKKVSTRSRLLLDQWKIPSCCLVHKGSFGFFKEAALLGSLAPFMLLLLES